MGILPQAQLPSRYWIALGPTSGGRPYRAERGRGAIFSGRAGEGGATGSRLAPLRVSEAQVHSPFGGLPVGWGLESRQFPSKETRNRHAVAITMFLLYSACCSRCQRG